MRNARTHRFDPVRWLAAWATLLLLLAGCQPVLPEPTAAPSQPGGPASIPSQTPSPAPQETLQAAPGILYTVVGIPADQTLPLYREPSTAADIAAQLAPTARSIRPAGGGTGQESDGWLQVSYQGVEGWADRSHLALQQGDLPDELVALGQLAAAALREGAYGRLEGIVHPQLCLRFAPYPYLRETDRVFCPGELAALPDSEDPLLWGNYDGSGEPIQLTFPAYHERFVYDADFFQPAVVGFNQEVSSGNMINNLAEVFPDGIMVEYYFPGFDPQYGGMDWRSLRLVFVQMDGEWYLAALIHCEWTI